MAGASERVLGGASERALGGASERALCGSSERPTEAAEASPLYPEPTGDWKVG